MGANPEAEQTVIDLLLDQHTQIKQMFANTLQATGDRKRDLFQDLVRLLAVHEGAEEQIVHPTARRKIKDGEKVISARLGEEHEAKQALADLYDLGVDHPDFDTRLSRLAEAVMNHAAAEEREEFSELRATIGHDELVRMAGAVRKAESVAPTRPHPAAGQSAAANMLAGPPLAVFDRIRDAMRDWAQTR